jgi:hypothetical protein
LIRETTVLGLDHRNSRFLKRRAQPRAWFCPGSNHDKWSS